MRICASFTPCQQAKVPRQICSSYFFATPNLEIRKTKRFFSHAADFLRKKAISDGWPLTAGRGVVNFLPQHETIDQCSEGYSRRRNRLTRPDGIDTLAGRPPF
jgi:hypothetical protein